mmetsp:Transcript_43704/g.132955  ORF Transcript_43704/g.132955 Transcript_43704/m.132955 type:complete len:86 (-) Transcript_43704:105-362(-)
MAHRRLRDRGAAASAAGRGDDAGDVRGAAQEAEVRVTEGNRVWCKLSVPIRRWCGERHGREACWAEDMFSGYPCNSSRRKRVWNH